MNRLMLTGTVLLAATLPAAAQSGCPLDHIYIGQEDGNLVADTSELYRLWDLSGVPYSGSGRREHYELYDLDGWNWRGQPGTGSVYAGPGVLDGMQGRDYRICLQRVYASPGLALGDAVTLTPWLTDDGDLLFLDGTGSDPLHVHMSFYTLDPNLPDDPHTVVFRLVDTFGAYGPSDLFAVHFGADPPGIQGDYNHDGTRDANDLDILWEYWDAPYFDLTGDDTCDGEDVDRWLDLYGTRRGDADLDRDVDRDDLDILRAGMDEPDARWRHGDFTHDRRVDAADYLVWKRNCMGSSPPGQVPEPGSVLLLAVPTILAACRGRRRRDAPTGGRDAANSWYRK